jgi:8-oxo-dGTP diphosphatase
MLARLFLLAPSNGLLESPVPPTRIGIAIVQLNERYLVGVREAGLALEGFAEFPGGKCKPDEPSDKCAERECCEETGIRVVAHSELDQSVFEYPHGLVELHFWLCSVLESDQELEPAGTFRWLTREELGGQQFPAANEAVVTKLLGSA